MSGGGLKASTVSMYGSAWRRPQSSGQCKKASKCRICQGPCSLIGPPTTHLREGRLVHTSHEGLLQAGVPEHCLLQAVQHLDAQWAWCTCKLKVRDLNVLCRGIKDIGPESENMLRDRKDVRPVMSRGMIWGSLSQRTQLSRGPRGTPYNSGAPGEPGRPLASGRW